MVQPGWSCKLQCLFVPRRSPKRTCGSLIKARSKKLECRALGWLSISWTRRGSETHQRYDTKSQTVYRSHQREEKGLLAVLLLSRQRSDRSSLRSAGLWSKSRKSGRSEPILALGLHEQHRLSHLGPAAGTGFGHTDSGCGLRPGRVWSCLARVVDPSGLGLVLGSGNGNPARGTNSDRKAVQFH